MSTYTFLSLGEKKAFLDLRLLHWSSGYIFSLQIRSKVIVLLMMCFTIYLSVWHFEWNHNRCMGKVKTNQPTKKAPKQTLPSLCCQIICMGRGNEENLCVYKGRCGKFKTILCLWFKNKTSPWDVLVSSFIKKYGQED